MIGAALFVLLSLQVQPAPDCTYDRQPLMDLSFQAFDQTWDGGWRPLGEIVGCEKATADLIADYRRTNAAKLAERRMRSQAQRTRAAKEAVMDSAAPASVPAAAEPE